MEKLLHYAVRSGNYDAVNVLLEAGADPNIENQDGSIPLNFAFNLPVNIKLVELLLKHGADVHHQIIVLVTTKSDCQIHCKTEPQLWSKIEPPYERCFIR